METHLLSQIDLCDYPSGSVGDQLASYVKANPERVAAMSVHDLAQKCDTSASSIVRFCKGLGCSGYSDFKQSLVYSLALRKQVKVSSLDDFKAEDSAKDIIEKVTMRNIQALELCIKALKVESLEKCVQLMHKAKSIDLFGVGASFVVAKDFYQKLIRVAKPVNLDGDWQVQLTYARNMTKDDLAIAVSYSGLTKETAQCAKVAHERGAKVIAITKNDGRTRLAHISDVILGVPETEAYLRAGAMTSRMAQLNIVDILYMSYVHDDLEEYSQLFMHNYIGKDEG